jgi:hypothetical protein
VGMVASPLVGRALGAAAKAGLNVAQDATSAITEGAISRSAARSAASETPIKDAMRTAGAEMKKAAGEYRGVRGALHGGGLAAVAHYAPGGHYLAPIIAALPFAKPALKAAAVAADEGLAALSRRVAGVAPEAAADAEEAAGAASKAIGPITREAPLSREAPRAPLMLGPMEPEEARAAAQEAVNPLVAQLDDALKTATKEQAKDIQAAIDKIKQHAATVAERPARPAPEKLAPSLEERAAAMRAEPLRKVAEAPPSRSEPDLFHAPEAPKAEAKAPPKAPPKAEGWQPSRFDYEAAKKAGMPLDAYREQMAAKAGYSGDVYRLAQLASKTKNVDKFVMKAGEAGLPEADARRIWYMRHPNVKIQTTPAKFVSTSRKLRDLLASEPTE